MYYKTCCNNSKPCIFLNVFINFEIAHFFQLISSKQTPKQAANQSGYVTHDVGISCGNEGMSPGLVVLKGSPDSKSGLIHIV